jgi:hypothetical protein
VQTSLQLIGEEMDGRHREIGQPASVIHVEVRQKDVSHICRVIAQCFDLSDGCLVQVTLAANDVHELPHRG